MRFRVGFSAVLGATMLFAPTIAHGQQFITKAQPHLPAEPLSIHTAKQTVKFEVEVARTGLQQEIGLMFRTSVPLHKGMIFPMVPVREATFWMKNTIIPLDMLFIRTDGTIARITTAKALSEDIDDSGEPVAAVLELGAGQAAQLGIHEGDRVSWDGLSG